MPNIPPRPSRGLNESSAEVRHTSEDSSATPFQGRDSSPLAPRIGTCDARARATLVRAYHQAYRWASAARRWIVQLASSARARDRWNAGPAARLFGPYQASRVRRVRFVLDGLLRRFHHGYSIRGKQVAPTLACFPESYHRCRKGLLGNASILGTIRLCPRLLERGPLQAASVVFHELMHQGLGVDDQRHQGCDGSRHRCYSENAPELVRMNRYDLAVRNIDNYVKFAQLIASAA
jgi:hypothetical protein